MITPPGHYKPVGDPTRWGAAITQNIGDLAGEVALITSEQFISAHTIDPYPRPWSIIGTVAAPPNMWSLANYPRSGSFPANLFTATLSCTLGTGQAQLTHNIDLRAVIDADAPFYRYSNPGDEMFSATGGVLVLPFVIPGGAIIGNAIAIRASMGVWFGAATPNDPFQITTTVLLTPFAAGEGL